MRYVLTLLAFALCLAAAPPPTVAAETAQQARPHALSLKGAPKYGPDSQALDYVNPAAPKGGEIRLYSVGGFDSLNPYIIKGEPAPGLNLMYQSLMESAADDPLAEYGMIAESVTVAPDLSSITFYLRDTARWHDGKPITAEDVVFSFTTLKEKGEPLYRFYYSNVASATAQGPKRVRFDFSGPRNRELPQIMGQLPILPKHYWQSRDFEKTTLEPPLGSGAYRIKAVEANRSISYERVPDFWAKDLMLNRGRNNFDIVRYDIYRDTTVALEAFKSFQYDFRREDTAKNWATAYDFPALREGRVIKMEVPHSRPTGMQGFVFNTRREKFADRRVRQALGMAFDFEWSNKNLFFGQYTRTASYFANSELASSGLPGPEELAILEPHRGKVPIEVFSEAYAPPATNGDGNPRANLLKATELLKAAGWQVRDGKLVNAKGEPFAVEFLLVSPDFERVVSPYIRNLERLGVNARIRTVESAQYQNRIRDFDFDIVVGSFGQSDSPGNEQREYWSAAAADRPGSRNIAGIKDPVVDALIENLIRAQDRESLVFATRALDRVLLAGHYLTPQWHLRFDRFAYWDKFGQTGKHPPYGADIFSWWVDAEKAAKLGGNRAKP
jgi:microcin C transport system substrate-binding protein